MGRQFTYNGRDVWLYQAAEADAVFRAVRRAAGELVVPPGEGCAEFVGQLGAAASQYLSSLANSGDDFDPNSEVFSVVSLSDLQVELGIESDVIEPLPERTEDARLFNLWTFEPTLRSMVSYAPYGLAVPLEWESALAVIVAGVVAVDSGRCAIRTRWGLVGAVAVLGALVVGGGALIYANRKRR